MNKLGYILNPNSSGSLKTETKPSKVDVCGFKPNKLRALSIFAIVQSISALSFSQYSYTQTLFLLAWLHPKYSVHQIQMQVSACCYRSDSNCMI